MMEVMDVTRTKIYISTFWNKKLTNHKSSLSSIDPFLKPSQTSNLSIDTISLRLSTTWLPDRQRPSHYSPLLSCRKKQKYFTRLGALQQGKARLFRVGHSVTLLGHSDCSPEQSPSLSGQRCRHPDSRRDDEPDHPYNQHGHH